MGKNVSKKFEDLTSKRYGRLTVIGVSAVRGTRNQLKWECVCDCGVVKNIITSHLKDGRVKSCGCLAIKLRTKHGLGIIERRIHGYNSWDTMKQRCYNVKNNNYPNYGGRGIKVCDRWLKSFKNFITDMGVRPSKYYSIERNDVNGDYEPSNCFWENSYVQSRNKRNNVIIRFNGVEKYLADWAKELRTSGSQIKTMMKKKSFEEVYKYYSARINNSLICQ